MPRSASGRARPWPPGGSPATRTRRGSATRDFPRDKSTAPPYVPSVELKLVIEGAGRQIEGQVVEPRAGAQRFVGWLQLVQILETALEREGRREVDHGGRPRTA